MDLVLADSASINDYNEHGFTWLHSQNVHTQPLTANCYSVEGNIAAGKTTFINEHCSALHAIISMCEPLDLWRNHNGTNLLEQFYRYPHTHAYNFQTHIQDTYNNKLAVIPQEQAVLTERSAWAATNIFSPLLRDSCYITTQQLSTIQQRPLSRTLSGVVYLYTSPLAAWHRLCIRDRREERGVTLSYLERLHELHNQLLVHTNPGFPVCVVNASLDSASPSYKQATKSLVALHKFLINRCTAT